MALFSDRSILTMLHGIALGGAALVGLAVVLYALYSGHPRVAEKGVSAEPRLIRPLAVGTAVVLWLTVLAGTYIIFPPYRAAPPEGTTDLSQYPRALIMSNPDTVWLHAFAMESKEHMPWIAAMLATAVAVVIVRERARLLQDVRLTNMAITLVAVSLLLVAYVSLMGVFVDKVAPLH